MLSKREMGVLGAPSAPSHTGNTAAQHFASHSSPILHLTTDLEVSHHAEWATVALEAMTPPYWHLQACGQPMQVKLSSSSVGPV